MENIAVKGRGRGKKAAKPVDTEKAAGAEIELDEGMIIFK